MFEIVNDRLHVDGRPVPFVPSPNTSGARMEPALIVLHDTAGSTAEGAVSWFKQTRSKVSAHVVIERDGAITQCVEFDRVAWHAGASSWQGRSTCNGFSIGIEIVNPGGLKGTPHKAVASFGKTYVGCAQASSPAHWSKLWLPYTEPQLAAVEALIRALAAAYPGIVDLTGHHDISPGRKEDPTPLMPWPRMRAALGTRPKPVSGALVAEAQTALRGLGYQSVGPSDGHIGPLTRAALRTFQEQNRLPVTGALDEKTFTLLVHGDGAKEMPLGARAEIEAVPGSRTVSAATAIKAGSLGVGGLQVGSALVDAGGALGDAGDAVSTVETGVGLVDRGAALVPKLEHLVAWLQTPPGIKTLLVLGVIVGLWKLAGAIKAWRLADAKSGANVTK